MTTVQQILEHKGTDVHSVHSDQTVLDALNVMAQADVGSVMVMSGDKVEGIFTERQYARNVFIKGKASPTTLVRDVMEADVICVRPEQTIEACMALMTEKHIRHLPVMSEGRLVGLVSVGDLMKSIVENREFQIDQLVEYVGGRV